MERAGKVIIFDSEKEAMVWYETIRQIEPSTVRAMERLMDAEREIKEIRYETKAKMAELNLISSII